MGLHFVTRVVDGGVESKDEEQEAAAAAEAEAKVNNAPLQRAISLHCVVETLVCLDDLGCLTRERVVFLVRLIPEQDFRDVLDALDVIFFASRQLVQEQLIDIIVVNND